MTPPNKATLIPVTLASLLLLFFAHPALAATDNSGFQPRITTQLQYEDNVRRAPDQSKQSDSLLILKPILPLLWDFGKHKLDLTYKGEYGRYNDQNILNYNDHELKSHLLLDHSNRLNTEYELGQIRDHYTPDDNNVIANLITTSNKWEENYAKAKLAYGRSSSQGQFVTRADYKQLRYINNNQQSLDVNTTGLTNTFYYRIAPNTRIPTELGIANKDYQNTTPATDPSGNEYRLLTGVTWDASTISSAIFQLGLLKRSYDNTLYADTTILMLRLYGTWKPNTYTNITFGAIRDIQDSQQINTKPYIQNHIHAEMTHMATSRTAFIVGALYTKAKTDNSIVITDDRINLRIQAKYSLLHWLKVGAGYNYTARASNYNVLDFKSNVIMIDAQAQFDD